MLRSASFALLTGLWVLSACSTDAVTGDGDPELHMRVEWLTGTPSATLPDDVERIRIVRTIAGVSLDAAVSRDRFGMAPDGTPYVVAPLLTDLPTDTPIEFTIEGLRAGDAFGYVGHVGPIVLGPGQVFYADLKMYELGVSATTVVEGTPSVFLTTATALPDGRVLVSGGYDTIENMADCPAALPAGARCFALTATDEAWVFDPNTGRFHSVAGGMLAARAGHTATLLPDGRVLVAGGAPAGIFALIPIGGGADPTGYEPRIVPRLTDDSEGAHETFEIFVADANRETEDTGGDGDPGRGGFVGSAGDPRVPGRLNRQRFLHAAVATTVTDPNRVLLVGGHGSAGADDTYEVYDDRKAGGYGCYDNSSATLTSRGRITAGAVELGSGQVWIFGGTVASTNDDLAEVWTPDPTNVNGGIEAATAATTGFPGAGDHPEYSLVGPSVAAVGDGGSHAVVVGWVGPRCMAGGTIPVFGGSELCPSMGGGPRSQTVSGASGDTVGFDTNSPHGFAGVAALDDGTVAITGGIANLLWTRQPSIEVFTGEVSGGQATLSSMRFMMRSARVLHASAPLPDAGILSVGGINLSMDVMNITLQTTAEVLYLPRAQAVTSP